MVGPRRSGNYIGADARAESRRLGNFRRSTFKEKSSLVPRWYSLAVWTGIMASIIRKVGQFSSEARRRGSSGVRRGRSADLVSRGLQFNHPYLRRSTKYIGTYHHGVSYISRQMYMFVRVSRSKVYALGVIAQNITVSGTNWATFLRS